MPTTQAQILTPNTTLLNPTVGTGKLGQKQLLRPSRHGRSNEHDGTHQPSTKQSPAILWTARFRGSVGRFWLIRKVMKIKSRAR